MNYTLKEWVVEWLITYKRIMVKPSTFDSYMQYAQNVSCDKLLTELQPADIQKMINNMIESGKQLSTIKHMLTLVRQSLRKAKLLGMISNMECMDNLELPRNQAKVVNGLSEAQVDLLLENVYRTFYGDFYTVLLLTGCRVGELIALRWSDVDFFNNCIYITNTDYNGTLQPVKTSHGVRSLPMYGKVSKILKKRFRSAAGSSERVFLNTLARPIKYRTLLDNWHWYCNSIGIYANIGLHTLRHTFAHMSIRAGIPVKVVSYWLGHADVRITLNIYDSVDYSDMKEASEHLEEMFG